MGRPTVMVCHAHEAVWKETIDAVCKFCGYRAAFILVFDLQNMSHVLQISERWAQHRGVD